MQRLWWKHRPTYIIILASQRILYFTLVASSEHILSQVQCTSFLSNIALCKSPLSTISTFETLVRNAINILQPLMVGVKLAYMMRWAEKTSDIARSLTQVGLRDR
jgi:hypothetical protein